ncbi:MAG: membrane integrity-associated transporter subunit PqiC [Alphaproteobacteria bacterium]|nr:membrane integrity-associated transporter subunit PqiC [Alphaproteobacteria bacterium]
MKKGLAVVFCLLLAGCFFSTKNSTFYLLESQKQTEALSQKKVSIAVADITIPDYLDKPQIVLQRADEPELKISEFHRWASDLPTMIQNTLIEDLQNAFAKGIVKPLLYGSSAKYVVKINIDKMSGFFLEEAYLKGVWQIMSTTGRILRQSEFDLKAPAGKTYASYVQAQSGLLSELALSIAQNIARL